MPVEDLDRSIETDARREPPTPSLRRLIDVKGAAGMYSTSWRTFLRWADAGLVPWGVKIGGRRLFRLDELEAHIRDGCRPVKKGGAK
jgi:hypothetical protein